MKTKLIYIASVFFFLLLLFIIPIKLIDPDLGKIILTCSTFLFGFLAGFFIVITTTDYNGIKNVLAVETANWIILYRNVLIYDKKIAKKLSDLLDKYVRESFDYEIIDYAKCTTKEFNVIEKIIREIKINKEKNQLYQEIQKTMGKAISSRQQLIILGNKALSMFQWLILFVLSFLVIATLYGIRSGGAFFEIIVVLISSSIVLILLLIRDLDSYIWNEKTFGFYIFENVLRSIGNLPYYPEESIRYGRIKPTEEKYRVGILIEPGKSWKRKIEIRKND